MVLNDRKLLAEDGMVVVVLSMSSHDHRLLCEPEIVTRGIVSLNSPIVKRFPMNIIRFRILALPIVCLFVNKPHWRKPLGKFWERIILLNIRMTVESSSCG